MATYQKILATKIFDGYSFLEPNKVLIIKDDLVHEIINKENAGDDIQKIEGILCPGFINTHCHLELSYLKNKIPKNTGMVDFILAVLQGRNTALDIIVQSIKDAETEMIINGIVAVGDICNTTNTIAQKLQTNLHYTNFIELSGFSPNAAQQRFAEGKKIQQQFFQHYLNATLVPHAPYSVSNNLFALIQNENPLITTMHYNESHAEKEFMHYGTGDFQRLYKTIELDISYWAIEKNKHFKFPNALQSNILVHNVVTSDEDIVAQKNTATQTSICICPNANIYISNGLPNVDELAKSDINICLGTDSLASNDQLDILAEIKTIQKNFPKIELPTLLQWATINGAKALGIANLFGSFEKGKSAKYVVVPM